MSDYIPHLVVSALAALVGLVIGLTVNAERMPSDLIGATIGAAIAVGGGVWAARHQVESGRRSYADALGEALERAHDSAEHLAGLPDYEGGGDHRDVAQDLRIHLDQLLGCIDFLEMYHPFKELGHYAAVRSLLKAMVQLKVSGETLKREANWLNPDRGTHTVTVNVVVNAVPNLRTAGEDLKDVLGPAATAVRGI